MLTTVWRDTAESPRAGRALQERLGDLWTLLCTIKLTYSVFFSIPEMFLDLPGKYNQGLILVILVINWSASELHCRNLCAFSAPSEWATTKMQNIKYSNTTYQRLYCLAETASGSTFLCFPPALDSAFLFSNSYWEACWPHSCACV